MAGAGWNPTARPQALPKVTGAQGNPAGSPGGTPGGPAAGTGAKSWAGKNRTTLLAAGAGGVVLLALVMKNRAGASTSDTAAAGTMTTVPQNLAAYDSSSSDVYNAVQPQLEALRDMYEEWSASKDASSTIPTPAVPEVTTPTTSTPVNTTTRTGGFSLEDVQSAATQAQYNAILTAQSPTTAAASSYDPNSQNYWKQIAHTTPQGVTSNGTLKSILAGDIANTYSATYGSEAAASKARAALIAQFNALG